MANWILRETAARSLLRILGAERLRALCDEYDLDPVDRLRIDSLSDAILGSQAVDWQSFLEETKRDVLKEICIALNLESDGKEKEPIIARILNYLRVSDQASKEAPKNGYPPETSTILRHLGAQRLRDVCDYYKLQPSDRLRIDSLSAAIVESSAVDWGKILVDAKREQLKDICRECGLDINGRDKEALVDRILMYLHKNEQTIGERGKHLGNNKKNRTTKENFPRPKVFIGYSNQGSRIGEAIEANLHIDAECTKWSSGAMELSRGILENLVEMANKVDFAILVLTADDLLIKQGTRQSAARDNVLFELGLFMGVLGRERTYFVRAKDEHLELPTDLLGVHCAEFIKNRDDRNLIAAVGGACGQIKAALQKHGRRSTQ